MALKTFSWCPRTNAASQVNFHTRKAQFGDGYSQVSGEGINNRGQQWDLEFVDNGHDIDVAKIAAFLDEHAGIKSFLWKPPLNTQALFRCDGYKTTALGGAKYSLSATFIQAFAP